LRKETVPIDMSSEQKTILGFISIRQLIYLIIGGAILYTYIPIVFNIFPHFIVGGIAALISAIPTLVFIFIFGFWKKTKLHLNFDHYFLIKLNYGTQIGIWRKGSRSKNWKVTNK